MTDKAALLALADKLEKATEPSWELDQAIGNALGYVAFDMCTDMLGNPIGPPEDAFPEFTRSIDAAVRLVPEGHEWHVEGASKFHAKPWAGVNPPDAGSFENPRRTYAGATPPLAICAAALRARAYGAQPQKDA